MEKVAILQQEVEKLRDQLAQRDAQVDSLKEQIKIFLARRFGTSSEKVSPDQINLFNEAESLAEENQNEESNVDEVTVKSHQRTQIGRASCRERV